MILQNFPPFMLLQSSQYDAYRCGTPLWADGGRVSDKRGTNSATADDRVSDTEASTYKLSSRAAGQVQEFLPDGEQKRRRRTL